jgi:hypothetical protein
MAPAAVAGEAKPLRPLSAKESGQVQHITSGSNKQGFQSGNNYGGVSGLTFRRN